MSVPVHTHLSLASALLLLARVVLLGLLSVLGAPNPLLKDVDDHFHLQALVQNLRQTPSPFLVQPSERHMVVTKDYGGNSVNQKRFQEALAPSSWRPREEIETPHGFVTRHVCHSQGYPQRNCDRMCSREPTNRLFEKDRYRPLPLLHRRSPIQLFHRSLAHHFHPI